MFEVELYEDLRGEWRWRLLAENGRIVADSSEGYTRKDAARGMARRIFDGALSVDPGTND